MGAQPREIEREIEKTRSELGYNVDALADRVRPSRVMHRGVSNAKNSAIGLKDRVMGSGESATTSVKEGVSGSAGAVQRGTQGNPIAAGLIAFGIGWLAASVFPASEKEMSIASDIEQPVRDAAGAIGSQLKESAQDVGQQLKEPAQEAVESVKERATQAAQEVKDEARTRASDVSDQARGS